MSHKNRITFTKPEEPAFIQRMKAKIGYKEGPTVDTKREQLASADDPDDGRVEPDDEKPTVVVVKDGDLTAEEAEELQHDLDLDDKTPGKFQFKKPDKLKNRDAKKFPQSSTKRASGDERESPDRKQNRISDTKPNDSECKPVTKKQLLSFDDEEEES